MKTFDKILLFLLLIVTMAVAIAVIVLETGLMPYPGISETYLDVKDTVLVKAIVISIAALVALFDLRLFCAAFATKQTDSESANKTQIESSEIGATYITIEALNVMARKRCMSFRFVNDCKTSVTVVDNGIIVAVKIVPMPDVKLPESMLELQTQLKETLVEQAGINVVEIPILILPQSTPAKARPSVF